MDNDKLHFSLWPKQQQFLNCGKFEVLYGGGSDAGKSYALIVKMLTRASKPGAVEGLCRYRAASIPQSFLMDWKTYIPESMYQIVVRDQMIRINGGGTIIWFGVDDEQKLGSKNLTGCGFEELAEHPTERGYNKVLTLIRKEVKGLDHQAYSTSNPSENPKHWIIDRFGGLKTNPRQDISLGDRAYIHTTSSDVGRSEKWIQRMFGGFSRSSQARLRDGIWGVGAEGLVFDGFGDANISDRDEVGRRVIVGVDEGSTKDNPFAAIRVEADGDRIFITREAYREAMTDPNKKVAIVQDMADGADSIVVDYSAMNLIHMMRDLGLPARPCKKGDKSISAGIEKIRRRFAAQADGRPNFVVCKSCKNTITELQSYSYGPETGMPKDENNHCIAEGELVRCERGLVPIEMVTTDDLVWTRGGWRRVLFAGQTDRDREIVEVVTDNGSVRCTPDHRIWTENRGFVRSDALRYADSLLLEDSAWSNASHGEARSTADTRRASGDQIACISSGQSLAAPCSCIGKFGSIIAETFRRDGTFTTSTATAETTESAIWNASRRKSTSRAGTSSALSGRQGPSPFLNGYAHLPSRGIQRRTDSRSTARSAGWPTRTSFRSSSNAHIAETTSRRERLGTTTAFAPTAANQQIDARAESMTSTGHVPNAAPRSGSTNTHENRLVRGRVARVAPRGIAARVYDLTIEEHHEFVCGGVLVSNCIDAIRYAVQRLDGGSASAEWSGEINIIDPMRTLEKTPEAIAAKVKAEQAEADAAYQERVNSWLRGEDAFATVGGARSYGWLNG